MRPDSSKLIPCPACSTSLSSAARTCPKCGHPMQHATQQIIVGGWGYGWEYKSAIKLFGIPLIHIASGFDLEKRRKRIACGIIAIGDIALGAISLGGLSIGLLSLGGLALGGLTLGGLAIGGIAVGGAAIGYVAVGGAAVGYYAVGGGAFGKYILGPLRQDPEALKFFSDYFGINFPSLFRR